VSTDNQNFQLYYESNLSFLNTYKPILRFFFFITKAIIHDE